MPAPRVASLIVIALFLSGCAAQQPVAQSTHTASPEASETEAPVSTPAPPAADGTREHPFELGTPATIGPWQVMVTGLTGDITPEVLQDANNSAPDEAAAYVSADVRAEYLQGNFIHPGLALNFFYQDSNGKLYRDVDRHLAISYLVGRFQPDGVSVGKITTGRPVISVPSGDLSGGLLMLEVRGPKGEFLQTCYFAL